jgi:hypothetical protein
MLRLKIYDNLFTAKRKEEFILNKHRSLKPVQKYLAFFLTFHTVDYHIID